VAVAIPDSVLVVRVPRKPGWRIALEQEPLARLLLIDGRRVETRVAVVT
jgi:hypothetical protein